VDGDLSVWHRRPSDGEDQGRRDQGRIVRLEETLDAIADKVREYAPSRLTTCEVMTRRKDSRQCEARGLNARPQHYER
jgi:hypothetical protein